MCPDLFGEIIFEIINFINYEKRPLLEKCFLQERNSTIKLNIMLKYVYELVSLILPCTSIMRFTRQIINRAGGWMGRFSESTVVFQTAFYARLFLTASSVIASSARWIIRSKREKQVDWERRKGANKRTREREEWEQKLVRARVPPSRSSSPFPVEGSRKIERRQKPGTTLILSEALPKDAIRATIRGRSSLGNVAK